MNEAILKVESNIRLEGNTYELKLSGAYGDIKTGQFVEISLDGFYLRRPFSVADYEKGIITLIYKVVGQGTKAMTELVSGNKLNCLIGLGNGFNISKAKKPLIIGGGIGVAPLYYLAKEFNKKGITPTIVLGFKNNDEIFYIKQFSDIGKTIIATDDGSFGFHGNVIDAIKAKNIDYDYYYACGPMVMLKSLADFSTAGELSLEARMGCGFGACMGCSILTVNGTKRVCKEGPVFDASEVIFNGY